jgi:hypothetical protein
LRYSATQYGLLNQSLQLPYSACFNIFVGRKSRNKAEKETSVERQERQRTLLEKSGFAQLMFERILKNLTDRRERILFGLEAPEEPKRSAAMRPGASGGDMVCDICGKSGLTKRGLGLHMVRLHKEEKEKEKEEEEAA